LQRLRKACGTPAPDAILANICTFQKSLKNAASPHGYCGSQLAALILVSSLWTSCQMIDFTRDKNRENPIDLKRTKRKFTIVL
jgi:hypothetical protein